MTKKISGVGPLHGTYNEDLLLDRKRKSLPPNGTQTCDLCDLLIEKNVLYCCASADTHQEGIVLSKMWTTVSAPDTVQQPPDERRVHGSLLHVLGHPVGLRIQHHPRKPHEERDTLPDHRGWTCYEW